MNELNKKIKELRDSLSFNTMESRLLDVLFHAHSIDECHHVTENTAFKTIRDLAIAKANFFKSKGTK